MKLTGSEASLIGLHPHRHGRATVGAAWARRQSARACGSIVLTRAARAARAGNTEHCSGHGAMFGLAVDPIRHPALPVPNPTLTAVEGLATPRPRREGWCMPCAFGVERAAKRECLSDSSFCDLCMALCILPPLCRRAENTRSTPADEAHAASRYAHC